MSDTGTIADLTIDQIRAMLSRAVEAEQRVTQAQNTVLLCEEGGASFLQGIVDRATVKSTERWVGITREGFTFSADDGTAYAVKVTLTDVAAKAALPAPPARKK